MTSDTPRSESDEALEWEKLTALRREIEIGLNEAAAGRFSRKTVSDIADEVMRERP